MPVEFSLLQAYLILL